MSYLFNGSDDERIEVIPKAFARRTAFPSGSALAPLFSAPSNEVTPSTEVPFSGSASSPLSSAPFEKVIPLTPSKGVSSDRPPSSSMEPISIFQTSPPQNPLPSTKPSMHSGLSGEQTKILGVWFFQAIDGNSAGPPLPPTLTWDRLVPIWDKFVPDDVRQQMLDARDPPEDLEESQAEISFQETLGEEPEPVEGIHWIELPESRLSR
jgi:hypothetical protein